MAKTIVTVDQGGTGAETASAALTALGAAPSAFTQTGDDAVERTVDSKLKDTVSVMDFGATGLGAVDDSTEIQAAVDSLTTGGRLLFPRGTYKISTQVVIPGKIHLVGDAPNATRINADEDISPFKFYNSSASDVYEGGGISDMSISTDDAAIVIEVVDVWGITIERIRFRDGGTPPSATLIQCSGQSYETRIKDCRMVGADTFGVNFLDDCNSSSVEGCDFGLVDGATAIQAKDCNHTYIVNNRFEWATDDGGTSITLDNANNTNIAANSIGANTPPDSTHCQILVKGTSLQTTIDGNRIAQDVGMSQVITAEDTAKRIIISNNNFQIDGGVSCIVANGRPAWVISDNQFTLNADITGSIIDINGSAGNITVDGNVIDAAGSSNTGTGIRLRAGSTYTSISNNMVQGIGGSGAVGILIEANNGSPTSNVVDNVCQGNTTDISVSSQASINCSGNIGLVVGLPIDQGGTGSTTASAALTALGAAPSAFTQTGTGAVATTVDAKLKESVSVKDFGATGDGATDDTVKIQAAIDAFDNVLIPKGTYVLGADLTLDAGKTLSFLDGGIISVSSTKTLTINGCVDAGLYKIFEGSGTIRINPGETQEVVASWWGASPSATASVNTTAIQASIDALGKTYATTPIQTKDFTWRLPSGFYEIDAEIEFKTEIHYGKIFFDGVVQQTTSSANGIKFNNVHYSDINITKIIAEHYYGLGTRTSGSGVILDGYFDHSNLDMANGSGRIHGFEKGIYWSNKDDDCSLGYCSFTLGHIQHCHYGVYAVLQSNDGNSWMNTNIFRKGQISPAGAVYTNGSATPSISAITQASLGVITTSTDHGLSVDEDVIITGVVGMTEINSDTDIYLVNSVPTSTTFTLKQLDGHGPSATAVDTSAFTAYASGGVVARGTYGLVFKDQITGAGGFGYTNRFEFQTLEGLAKGYDLRSMAGCVVDCPYMEANLFDADLRAVKDMTWISGMNDWASAKHITDSNTESVNVLSPSNDTVHEGDLILGTKGINFDTYGGNGVDTDRGTLNYYPTSYTFAWTGGGATSYMNKGIEGGTSEPTSGSYRKGAIVWNTASIATGTSSGFMCKTYGTAGTLSGVTGTSVSSSDILTVNSVDNLSLYDNITIAGVSGTKTITAINAQTKKVTLSSAANATVSGAAVSYYNPTWQELVPYGTGVSKVGTPVDNQVGVWTGDGTIEGTTGLVFDSTGLGIGTDSPGVKLGVVGAIHTFGTGVTPGTAAGVQLAASNSSNDGYLWNFENADFLFGTNNVERLRIADGGRVTVKKSSNSEITALTSSTSITPDMDDANNFSLTLDHDTTLNDPSNMTAGQSGCIVITQGSTGGTCSIYGTKWHFEGGSTPTLSTLAGEVDTLAYFVASTSSIQAVLLKDIKTT